MMTEFNTLLFASQFWLHNFQGDIFESLVHICLVAWLKAFHLCKICGDPTFEPLFVLLHAIESQIDDGPTKC
jgi:hypothetical protein